MSDEPRKPEDRFKDKGWELAEKLLEKGNPSSVVDKFGVKTSHRKIRVILDVEGDGHPMVQVSLGGTHLGIINSASTKDVRERDITHSGTVDAAVVYDENDFEVECYRRGGGRWKMQTLLVEPIGGDEEYYKIKKFKRRFNPPKEDNESSRMEIRIPIKRKGNIWTLGITKKKKPS